MQRTVYGPDHNAFRTVVRDFFTEVVVPEWPDWERAGRPSRDFYGRAASVGLPGLQIPEEYGGAGQTTFTYNCVVNEEANYAHVGVGMLRVQMDIVLPYFLAYTTSEQKQRWLPKLASGELLAAIGMTEPGTGSDLAAIRTRAVRDGDEYVINGAKTFISGGGEADMILLVARTSDPPEDDRRRGLSLIVVPTALDGFSVGRHLDKIGLKAQDASELFFADLRVPLDNLVGDEGEAFKYLAANLPQERLSMAVSAQAMAIAAVRTTCEYVRNRTVFGNPLSSFQNTRFRLAECATDVEAGQLMCDRAIEELDAGSLTPADAAKVKLFTTEMQARVVDACLQLHGGYGFIRDYPIARMYEDARVTRIFGGTSEVMKMIIGKSMGL